MNPRIVALLLSGAVLSASGGCSAAPETPGPSTTVSSSAAEATTRPELAPGVTTRELDGRPVGVAVVEGEPWFALAADDSVAFPGGRTPVGSIPLRLSATRDGVWVSVFGDGRLVRLDGAGRVVQRVSLGPDSEPEGLAVDGRRLWVVSQGTNRVVRLDARSGRVLGRTPVGLGPRLLSVGERDVWVSVWGDSGVTAVRRSDGRVRLQRTDVCLGVQGIVEAEGSVWVACTVDGVLLRLDAETLDEQDRYPLEDADAVVTDGERVVAVGQSGPTALVVDAVTGDAGDPLVLGQERAVPDANVGAALAGDRLVVTHPDGVGVYEVPLTAE